MRDRNFYRGDYKQYQEQRYRNRVFFGISVAIVGIVLMLTTMHVLPCIDFEVSWPAILIALGVLIGFKSNFRNNAWWILIIIGIANFTPQFTLFGRSSRDYAWPAIIFIVGIAIALRPRHYHFRKEQVMSSNINNDSIVNIDIAFGGKKEVITSKDFKGGSVAVTFAGCEINLAQADFTDSSIVLDCRVSFGSLEIVVPSHWDVQNEVSPSFGSVEDERTIQTGSINETRKVLTLRGNCSFGSIEIKSY
jgi:predicted membrane protein